MIDHKKWLLGGLLVAGVTFAVAQANPAYNAQPIMLVAANAQQAPGSPDRAGFARAGAEHHESAQDAKGQAALLDAVRDATRVFKDVKEAERQGFSLLFGCVTGPDAGAMGLHFLNMDRLIEVNTSGKFYANRPQIVLYEPGPDGSLHLTGADFIVFASAWDELHPHEPPQLMGQIFHYFEAPNRFGLPAFYTLHVWAWKENPNGAFVNWHPNVSCQSFAGQTP
jgi:hypothetical protein